MTNLTEKQKKMLQSNAEAIQKAAASEGKTTEDILTEIYVTNLPRKTEFQGRIMAREIIRTVNDFKADYEQFKADKNLRRFIKKYQDSIDKQMPNCIDRCNYWLRISTAISLAAAPDGVKENTDEIVEEIRTMSVSAEKATEKLATELREKAAEVFSNSGIMFTALAQQADAFNELLKEDAAAKLIIDWGNDQIEYRAILSMLTYTIIKRNQCEGIPSEITASQVATVVCAQVEEQNIMNAVAEGSLAVDVMSTLLVFLGAAALLALTIAVPIAAAHLVPIVFGHNLVFPVVIATAMAIEFFLAKCLDDTEWMEKTHAFTKKTYIIVRKVVDKVRNLYNKIEGWISSLRKKSYAVHKDEAIASCTAHTTTIVDAN